MLHSKLQNFSEISIIIIISRTDSPEIILPIACTTKN